MSDVFSPALTGDVDVDHRSRTAFYEGIIDPEESNGFVIANFIAGGRNVSVSQCVAWLDASVARGDTMIMAACLLAVSEPGFTSRIIKRYVEGHCVNPPKGRPSFGVEALAQTLALWSGFPDDRLWIPDAVTRMSEQGLCNVPS